MFDEASELFYFLQRNEVGINENTPPDVLADYVEKSIMHRLCHQEMEWFQAKGKFIGKHPLLKDQLKRQNLEDLWEKNKEAFMDKYSSTKNTLISYRSKLAKGYPNVTPEMLQRVKDEIEYMKKLSGK